MRYRIGHSGEIIASIIALLIPTIKLEEFVDNDKETHPSYLIIKPENLVTSKRVHKNND